MSKKTKLFKVSDILKKVPNRFRLSVGASIRARQLQEGARPLIDNGHEDDTTIMTALREFDQNKIEVTEREPEPDFMDYEAIDTTVEDDVIGELLGGNRSSSEKASESDDAKASDDAKSSDDSESASDETEDVVAA